MSLMVDGGSLGTKWPIASLDELHLSLSLTFSSLLLQPLKRPATVFAVDPGVRWKTYTHKQHLLFMPYSPVIHSQHALATTAVQPPTQVTDRQIASARRQHVFECVQVNIWLLKPTAVIAVTWRDKHICAASVFEIQRSYAVLTAITFSYSQRWSLAVNTLFVLLPFSNQLAQNIGLQKNESFEYNEVLCWCLTQAIRTFPAQWLCHLTMLAFCVCECGPSLARSWQRVSVLIH